MLITTGSFRMWQRPALAWMTHAPSGTGRPFHADLLGLPGVHGHGWIGQVDLRCGRSGGCGRASDLVPGGEPDGHFAPVFVGAQAVTAWSKVRRYPTERGQKPLCMPCRVPEVGHSLDLGKRGDSRD